MNTFIGWIGAVRRGVARLDARLEYDLDACVLTDVGCQRDGNEDSVAYVKPADERRLREKGVLAVVADGMGGHRAGEVASRKAVESIDRVYYAHAAANPLKALEQAFVEANRDIFSAASADASLEGMGTTATALLLLGGRAYFAHVGDSRLYRLRGSELSLLSEEHTLVMEMVQNGMIAREEARQHPYRNVITRALGTHAEVGVNTPPQALPIRLGDRYVLCSDGLHDLVDDAEIKQHVSEANPYEAGHRLLELAKTRGGHDNISVIVLAVRARGNAEKPPPSTRT
jgi:protein phosphatase